MESKQSSGKKAKGDGPRPKREPGRSVGTPLGPPVLVAQSGDKLWMYVAGASIVAAPVGYGLRSDALAKRAKVDELKKQMLQERVKEKRDDLNLQQQKLDNVAGMELAGGMAFMFFAIAGAVMVLLLGLGVRRRYAAGAFVIPLTLAALWGVYEAGIESMVVSSLLAVALIYYMTSEPDAHNAREFESFRKFPVRREVMPELTPGYRWPAVVEMAMQVEQQKLLKRVKALPSPLDRILPAVGGGKPFGFLQLKEDLAYVAFVECDDNTVSDYVTVTMLLEKNAPAFVARPLPILDGVRVPNSGLKLPEDPEFTGHYMVEVEPGRDPKAVRAFLSPVIREELLTLPAVWLQVQGNVMALTLFGRFNAESVDHLVDIADVMFAEYGSDGGPSLLDPDDAEIVGAPKITKKVKKRKQGGASRDVESPA